MSSKLWSSSSLGKTENLTTNISNAPSNPKPFDSGHIIYLEIQSETKGQLDYISPEALSAPSLLGTGTSFQVNRELFRRKGGVDYYVAVKRVVTKTMSNEELQKRLSVVKRELRVLMHPPLRTHSCVVSILGYGYIMNASQNIAPYLVLEFSAHGTLAQYLQTCNIPLEERRELALDVAVALRSLHDCQIIHGDIKMDNVLVFDSADDLNKRPQLAKLADFGSSFFEDDFKTSRLVQYHGTTKYNAPEVVPRNGPGVRTGDSSPDMFKRADVYSFGLLLLEVILEGRSFIDKAWLGYGTDSSNTSDEEVSIGEELAFLERVTLLEEDSLLRLATGLVSPAPHHTDLNTMDPVVHTLMLCLKDDAQKRGSMTQVTKTLAQGINEERLRDTRPSVLMSGPMTLSNPSISLSERSSEEFNPLQPSSSGNLIVRRAEPDVGMTEKGKRTELRSDPIVSAGVNPLFSGYHQVEVDMFKVS
jgi:serine/threonine protein kinase